MPNVEYTKPVALHHYNHYLVDDINVYVDMHAKLEDGELNFVIKNFFMFKYVEAVGIKLI